MKAKKRNCSLIAGLLFGALFLGTHHAGASLISLPADNELFVYLASSSDFNNTGYLANSWQTLANADRMSKGPISISVPPQNLQIDGTAPTSAFLSFIEKKLDGLGLRLAALPGYSWMVGFGLIGLVSIRGGNTRWKHSMG
jgi:hypothetical protein